MCTLGHRPVLGRRRRSVRLRQGVLRSRRGHLADRQDRRPTEGGGQGGDLAVEELVPASATRAEGDLHVAERHRVGRRRLRLVET